MGPRVGLDGRKISSSPGFDPRPSHYTMYTLDESYNFSESLQERKKRNFFTHQERITIVWSHYRKPVEYTDDIPANDVKDCIFTMNVLLGWTLRSSEERPANGFHLPHQFVSFNHLPIAFVYPAIRVHCVVFTRLATRTALHTF